MQFAQYAQSILELDGLLEPLRHLAEACGVPTPEHENWYALLKHKLVPQLTSKPFLIVAVMGGTNTGKSLIFNHLAGEAFSAVDHRASGTKHPVCLVPKTDETASYGTILARHFDSFQCVTWANAEQPLKLSDENHLFWLEGENVPERLLLLDTPDFDADRQANWDRAKSVRHTADVLIAVLTEQKYNDAAVRRFFREAAEAGKPIIILFNMIDLDGDMQHLSRWLEQFCQETGTQPIDILAAPYDRERAETLTLPFYAVRDNTFVLLDIKTELSDLHFDTIKTQTLLGAIKVLDDPATGVQSYLDAVQHASSQFADALATLENIGDAEVQWSGLPAAILADEVRTWWNDNRPAWSQKINAVYRTVGGGLLWSVRKTVNYFKGSDTGQITTLEEFRAAEQRTAIEFVGKIMDKLTTLADTENPVLRREISELTSGEHRALLLQRAYSVLDSLPPVNQEFRQLLHQHLLDWAKENPKTAAWMQMLDNIMTAAHPLVTVTLAVSGGWMVAAALPYQVAGGAAAAAVGETVIQAGSEGIAGKAARLFRQIQEDYVLTRSKGFAEGFQKELWRDIMDRLEAGASVRESDVFKRCRNWQTESVA